MKDIIKVRKVTKQVMDFSFNEYFHTVDGVDYSFQWPTSTPDRRILDVLNRQFPEQLFEIEVSK